MYTSGVSNLPHLTAGQVSLSRTAHGVGSAQMLPRGRLIHHHQCGVTHKPLLTPSNTLLLIPKPWIRAVPSVVVSLILKGQHGALPEYQGQFFEMSLMKRGATQEVESNLCVDGQVGRPGGSGGH